MADVFEIAGGWTPSGGWSMVIGDTDYLAFWGWGFWVGLVPGIDFPDMGPIPLGAFQQITTISGPALTHAVSEEIWNLQYAGPDAVYLWGNYAPDTLNTTNVPLLVCTIRLAFTSGDGSVAISHAALHSYETLPEIAATSWLMVAFERVDSPAAIRKDRVGETGLGYAWHHDYGISQGSALALDCSDRTSAVTHYYYFGLSIKALVAGVSTGIIRFEFDSS